MEYQVFKFAADPQEIIPHFDEVYRFLGYREACTDPAIIEMVNHMIEECKTVLHPLYGYRIVEGKVTGKESIQLEGVDFNPGPIITHAMKGCGRFAMLVSTVGAEFNAWMEEKKNSGDVMEMYLSDALGSVTAELTAGIGRAHIARESAQQDLKTTNSYSPGYCSWPVVEQHGYFSLLPEHFCGIDLSESALMHPIKSTSSIIGIDRNAVKRPYGCAICKKKDCFLKIARKKNHIE